MLCFGNEPAPGAAPSAESEPDPLLLEQEQIARVASDIAAYDGPAAVQYLESLEPEKRELADLAVALRWAYRDVSAAARWVELLPLERLIGSAPGIVAMWTRQDSEAAGSWASSLPEEARDAAWFTHCATLMVRKLAEKDNDGAAKVLGFVSLIRDARLRSAAMEELLDAWYLADATAGHDWAVAHRHLLMPEQIIRFLGEGSVDCG